MNSQVISNESDDETCFVLVEDTISYNDDAEDKPSYSCNRSGYISSDHTRESSANTSYEELVSKDFSEELMSAMEEEEMVFVSVDNVSAEVDSDARTKLSVKKSEKNDIINRLNLETAEDNISLSSCSTKSFVMVNPNEKQTPEIISPSSRSSITSTCSLVKQLRRPSHPAMDVISIDEQYCDSPSMEYDDTWQICAETVPMSTEKPQKILIRNLSFDEELKDAEGTDLMAPVFLAITGESGESGDHITDMKRKARSIEDLCSVMPSDDGPRLRSRSKSDVSFIKRLKSINKKFKHKAFFNEGRVASSENLRKDIFQKNEETIDPTSKHHLSFEDIRQSSLSSDCQFEFDEDEILDDPDIYISSCCEEEYVSDNFSGDLISVTCLAEMDGSEHAEESPINFRPREFATTLSVSSFEDEIMLEANLAHMSKYRDQGDLKRNPSVIPGVQCGFLEYPYGRRSSLPTPSTPRPGCNTASDHPGQSGGIHDRIVVSVNGEQRIIDMPLIEPYLKVLSHGGHHRIGDECHDIVVFMACFLPEKTAEKYAIIMEQLFYYCTHAVNLLVNDSYEVIFFNSALDSKNMPSRKWIKQYYDMVYYRLKKKLKNIYFVHQSLWLKAALRFSKLFLSSKVRKKIHLIRNIENLKEHMPLEYTFIPPNILKIDERFQ